MRTEQYKDILGAFVPKVQIWVYIVDEVGSVFTNLIQEGQFDGASHTGLLVYEGEFISTVTFVKKGQRKYVVTSEHSFRDNKYAWICNPSFCRCGTFVPVSWKDEKGHPYDIIVVKVVDPDVFEYTDFTPLNRKSDATLVVKGFYNDHGLIGYRELPTSYAKSFTVEKYNYTNIATHIDMREGMSGSPVVTLTEEGEKIVGIFGGLNTIKSFWQISVRGIMTPIRNEFFTAADLALKQRSDVIPYCPPLQSKLFSRMLGQVSSSFSEVLEKVKDVY
jgi:hypothetical protein